MGFLIAMIKNTYDRNEKSKLSNKYASRCEMNQVSFNFFRMLPFSQTFETDLVVISAHFNDPVEINLKKDDIWKKKIEKSIADGVAEQASIKEQHVQFKEQQDKLMDMVQKLIDIAEPKAPDIAEPKTTEDS